MAEGVIEVGKLPPVLEEAHKNGSYVKLWVSRETGKVEGKAYASTKKPVAEKKSDLEGKIKKQEGIRDEGKDRLEKLMQIDSSVMDTSRSVKAARKQISGAEEKIKKFKGKLAELK